VGLYRLAEGQYNTLKEPATIKVPRAEVWENRTGPHRVGHGVPGGASVEVPAGEQQWRAVVEIGLGTGKARFFVSRSRSRHKRGSA
jgi:carbon monoxide dehydrogenase subunit G